MAAFAATARPRSVPSRSAGSWLMTVSPAQCFLLALAMRNRNLAPCSDCMRVHASSTTTSPAVAGAGHDVGPDAVQREQRPGCPSAPRAGPATTTPPGARPDRWWWGRRTARPMTRTRTVRAVPPTPAPPDHRQPDRRRHGRRQTPAAGAAVEPGGAVGRRVVGERGGDVAEQRWTAPPRPLVGGDPGRGVGGEDRPVQRRSAGRADVGAEQHRDEGVAEQRTPGQGVGPAIGTGAGGQVQRVQPYAGRPRPDDGAAHMPARRPYSSSGSTTAAVTPVWRLRSRSSLAR